MGYWSEHPLGGDSPGDVKYSLLEYLFKEEGYDLNYIIEEVEMKTKRKRLKKKLPELVDNFNIIFEGHDSDYYGHRFDFVLPFTVIDYGVTINGEVISKKLKDMIKDGGGGDRGYHQPQKATPDNNWNKFEHPQDYCDQLRYYWDELITGKKTVDEVQLGKYKGLLQTLSEEIDKDQ
jgi:hypothetical protein